MIRPVQQGRLYVVSLEPQINQFESHVVACGGRVGLGILRMSYSILLWLKSCLSRIRSRKLIR